MTVPRTGKISRQFNRTAITFELSPARAKMRPMKGTQEPALLLIQSSTENLA
jgi:hypothetical protein